MPTRKWFKISREEVFTFHICGERWLCKGHSSQVKDVQQYVLINRLRVYGPEACLWSSSYVLAWYYSSSSFFDMLAPLRLLE